MWSDQNLEMEGGRCCGRYGELKWEEEHKEAEAEENEEDNDEEDKAEMEAVGRSCQWMRTEEV